MKNLTFHKTEQWAIDHTHSRIGFKIRHLMIAQIGGVFKVFDGAISITNEDITTTSIDMWIDTASIDTNNTERDEQLRGPDFFNTALHPRMRFVAISVGKRDEQGNHRLEGKLTINRITRIVVLALRFGGIMTDDSGTTRSGFQVDGIINRMDWGITFNSPLLTGGIMAGEEVTVSCEMELTKMKTSSIDSSWSHNGDSKNVF
jgi:polyisoprenoid-binding protein YceI